MIQAGRLDQGIEFLAGHGLNMFAVLDCAALPQAVADALKEAGIAHNHYARLLLLGSGGKMLWSVLQKQGLEQTDPVDNFSLALTARFVRDYLEPAPYFILYPGPYPVPLQQFGALAGWHQPSPLGIGINARFGLWFAYRVAFLTSLELPLVSLSPPASFSPSSPSPCASCADKPCITSCPARAVSAEEAFSIPACTAFRLQQDSDCAEQCLARLACPVASEHRYSQAQLRYHYRRSLRSIKAFALSGQ